MRYSLTPISNGIWELPVTYKKGMKVPVRVVGSEKLIDQLEEVVFEQSANVASLPGLVDYVVILPDAHSGYGASIGTVFATDPEKGGIISPGAVGYDINCGMRLIATNLKADEVIPRIRALVDLLFNQVPAGVGGEGLLRVTYNELKDVMCQGAKWMIEKGFGTRDDLECTEEKGCIAGADPEKVSQRAQERGKLQLATLGSGNHYLEIQKVGEIFDPNKAIELGILEKDQIVVMLHTGSRGLGHQVASDYLRIFANQMDKYHIQVADPQLSCLPFVSPPGQNYYQAMAAAANFAFANRQAITFQIRNVFEQVFGKSAEQLGMKLIWDVVHNVAKEEKRWVNKEQSTNNLPRRQAGKEQKLIVHRKGATRSFPNQPVIIGGSMETGSYLLSGTPKALELTFGSTAHGSGRTMSRQQAKKIVRGQELSEKLIREGIIVRSASWDGLAEEAGLAYKNITDVVKSVAQAGISTPVASFKPIGNIKG